ncbi:hypothetical protein ACWZHB_17310 [Nocardia sp. FBN12]|uniref:hypothetical protein n=1 Tax=Nocardia sp. FBN12 TaxID=3419766 RepID=UPI003CFC7C70
MMAGGAKLGLGRRRHRMTCSEFSSDASMVGTAKAARAERASQPVEADQLVIAGRHDFACQCDTA